MANDTLGDSGFCRNAAFSDLNERLGPTVRKILDFTKRRPATSLVLAIAVGMLIARRR